MDRCAGAIEGLGTAALAACPIDRSANVCHENSKTRKGIPFFVLSWLFETVDTLYPQQLFAFWEFGLTEVRRLGARWITVDEIGVTGKNQHRRQPSWNNVRLTGFEAL
jgi:hypothetical protein